MHRQCIQNVPSQKPQLHFRCVHHVPSCSCGGYIPTQFQHRMLVLELELELGFGLGLKLGLGLRLKSVLGSMLGLGCSLLGSALGLGCVDVRVRL